MAGILGNAGMARIPENALASLGRLRAHAGVQARVDGTQAWVRWDDAGLDALRELLPVPGAEFFEQRDNRWYRCGRSLPAFDVPEAGFASLAGLIAPAALAPVAAGTLAFPKVVLALKRCSQPRAATAMLCAPAALAAWAGMAPSARIGALSAARAGDTLLLLGRGLPALEGAERYWGERLLCPLGWAPDPELPESALLEAIGAGGDELAIMRKAAVEIVPRAALAPLTRASARMAAP